MVGLDGGHGVAQKPLCHHTHDVRVEKRMNDGQQMRRDHRVRRRRVDLHHQTVQTAVDRVEVRFRVALALSRRSARLRLHRRLLAPAVVELAAGGLVVAALAPLPPPAPPAEERALCRLDRLRERVVVGQEDVEEAWEVTWVRRVHQRHGDKAAPRLLQQKGDE